MLESLVGRDSTNQLKIRNKSKLVFCSWHALYKGTNKLLIDYGSHTVFRTLRLPRRQYRPTLCQPYWYYRHVFTPGHRVWSIQTKPPFYHRNQKSLSTVLHPTVVTVVGTRRPTHQYDYLMRFENSVFNISCMYFDLSLLSTCLQAELSTLAAYPPLPVRSIGTAASIAAPRLRAFEYPLGTQKGNMARSNIYTWLDFVEIIPVAG